MIRLFADLSAGGIALVTVIGVAIRRLRKPKESNLDHVRRLERENREMDDLNDHLTGGS